MLDVDRCVEIGVRAVAADHTAKRLLVGPLLPMCIIAHTARLGGISASDSDCGDTPFGGIPGKLLRDVGQVGSVQIGVHGSGLVLHRGDRQVFVGELCALVLSKALVDRLPHVPGEPLPALAARGGEVFEPFLFEACRSLALRRRFSRSRFCRPRTRPLPNPTAPKRPRGRPPKVVACWNECVAQSSPLPCKAAR